MTLSPALQALLARLPASDRLDFAGLLCALDAERYTGPVTLHLLNGRPQQVDLGAPVRLSIVQGESATGRLPLDTEAPPRTP